MTNLKTCYGSWEPANGISMMGRGVSVGGIGVMHLGGALKPSSSALIWPSPALDFLKCLMENYSYTGWKFPVDKNNFLVNSQGLRVQGYGVVMERW